ncbi:MAG: hypothetical protein LBE13_09080 [Bacteroidales bacterium]|jgi:hypothetical protein|nr:hypothetical protein [Bacteroidales bacterium]
MQLPVVIQKEVNTYLCDALPLCIILAHPGIQDWFLGHYLNICSGVCKHDGAYQTIRMRYLEGGIYFEPRRDREVLEYDPIRVESIINDIGLVKFLKENLESGFYTIAFFDEYFLSSKRHYKEKQYIHESLIYGYDDDKGGFYAVSFDKEEKFTSMLIPYSEAVEGIEAAYTQTADAFFRAYLHILKPVSSHVKFNYPGFQQQLKNYLNSAAPLIDIYHLSLYDHMEGDIAVSFQFGIGVYDELASAYSAIELSWMISWDTYMNFHLFAEHKRHVLKSLSHVNANVLDKPVLSTLLKSYNHIVTEHELLRIHQLKYFLKVSKYPSSVPLSFDTTVLPTLNLPNLKMSYKV